MSAVSNSDSDPEAQLTVNAGDPAQNAPSSDPVSVKAKGALEKISKAWEYIKCDCGPLGCGCGRVKIAKWSCHCSIAISIGLVILVLNQMLNVANRCGE